MLEPQTEHNHVVKSSRFFELLHRLSDEHTAEVEYLLTQIRALQHQITGRRFQSPQTALGSQDVTESVPHALFNHVPLSKQHTQKRCPAPLKPPAAMFGEDDETLAQGLPENHVMGHRLKPILALGEEVETNEDFRQHADHCAISGLYEKTSIKTVHTHSEMSDMQSSATLDYRSTSNASHASSYPQFPMTPMQQYPSTPTSPCFPAAGNHATTPRYSTLSHAHKRHIKATLMKGTSYSSCVENKIAEEVTEEDAKLARSRGKRADTMNYDNMLHRAGRASVVALHRFSTGDFKGPHHMTYAVVDLGGCFIIVLNAIQLAASTDFHRGWVGWQWIDAGFAAFFSLEMILKLKLAGIRGYFWGEDLAWNWFDSVIVALAVFEVIATFASGSDSKKTTTSLFRLVRLVRLARLTRLLRMPMFKELKLMVMGLYLGARTLFWSIIMISVPLCPVALFLRETLGEMDIKDAWDVDHKQETERLKQNFDRLGWAWFTCFRCVMGDCNDNQGRPIFVQASESQTWLYGAGYSAVMLFCIIGLFNVIIAIYVENIIETSKHNDDLQKRRRLSDEKLKLNLTTGLVSCFAKAHKQMYASPMSPIPSARSSKPSQDSSRTSTATKHNFDKISITPQLFTYVMQDPEAQRILDKFDIAEEDRLDLFDILDADGSGNVEVHELVQGIMKLRGAARRGDVVACRLLLIVIQDTTSEFMDRTDDAISQIMEHVCAMSCALGQWQKTNAARFKT